MLEQFNQLEWRATGYRDESRAVWEHGSAKISVLCKPHDKKRGSIFELYSLGIMPAKSYDKFFAEHATVNVDSMIEVNAILKEIKEMTEK